MKTHTATFLGLTLLFGIALFFFTKFFPDEGLAQLIEISLLFSGLAGLTYSIPLAHRELENISDANIPKVVHLGKFDFFRQVTISKFTSLSSTAFNLYGWVVSNEEMKRVLFVTDKNEDGTPTRGDYIHVWLPQYKNGTDQSRDVVVDLNPSKKALKIQDHIVIIYENGSGEKYYSMMTENYRYKFGELNHKKIASLLSTSARTIESFEIASRYE